MFTYSATNTRGDEMFFTADGDLIENHTKQDRVTFSSQCVVITRLENHLLGMKIRHLVQKLLNGLENQPEATFLKKKHE